MTETQRDRLFKLLDDHCTNDMIRSLLRQHKEGDNEIRVSGKRESILHHLREATERGTVPIVEVTSLLSRAEENGAQHIFFYKPSNTETAARCKDTDSIGNTLFGADWQNNTSFPQFYLEPKGVHWSDFRIENPEGTKYSSWTLKLYSGTERNKHIRTEELKNGMFQRVYQRYTARDVWIIKWHLFGLLELRIPTDSSMSKRTCITSLSELWNSLSDALHRDKFDPFDLRPSAKALIGSAVDNKLLYRIPNSPLNNPPFLRPS